MDKKNLKFENYWDPSWEEIHQKKEWGKYPSEFFVKFICSKFPKETRKNIKVLEIGFGAGAQIWFLSRENFQTYGIEGSSTAVTRANCLLIAEGLSANLICGDASVLPFENNYFDVVVDVMCLMGIKENFVKNINKEIYRITKPTGYFFSQTMGANSSLDTGVKQIDSHTFFDDGLLKRPTLIRVLRSILKLYQNRPLFHQLFT